MENNTHDPAPDGDDLALYNYESFVEAKFEPWNRFYLSPPLGVPAPDCPLTDLQEKTTQLREMWRSARMTIMEFGSFT